MNYKSKQSELYGCEQILTAFKAVFPDARVLQNVILPMDGLGGCPTAEFDVLVVCSAGVFAFEIKGYTGKSIEITNLKNGTHQWIIHREFGDVEIQDPLLQNVRKIKYLRDSVKGCLIRGFVYFTNEVIELSANANADVVTTPDLAYLARSLRQDSKRRNQVQSDTKVGEIVDAIMLLSREHTIEEHINNCRITGEYKRTKLKCANSH